MGPLLLMISLIFASRAWALTIVSSTGAAAISSSRKKKEGAKRDHGGRVDKELGVQELALQVKVGNRVEGEGLALSGRTGSSCGGAAEPGKSQIKLI